MRVLVVDDEPAVRQALERALRFEGFTAELAEDGMAGLAAHAERPADAIVLDIAMPRLDGLEMCRRLRAAGDRTPVLMLTAKAAVTERVDGLDAGADDYLVKPFALEELLARMRALLRRTAPSADNEILRFGDLSLDPGTREVRRGQRTIELTRTEFLLLELFLRNPETGAAARGYFRQGVGVRLRSQFQQPGGVHRLPQAKNRAGWRAQADPHRARSRLRDAPASGGQGVKGVHACLPWN